MMKFCEVVLTFTSSCWQNPMVWPFKWNLFERNVMWHYLFLNILQNEIWDFCIHSSHNGLTQLQYFLNLTSINLVTRVLSTHPSLAPGEQVGEDPGHEIATIFWVFLSQIKG